MNLLQLARRGWTQAGLLAAVLVVVVVGATLLGTCALLLTTASDRAQHAALLRTPTDRTTAEVVLTDLGADPAGATAAASAVLTDALAPVGATTSTWATSPVRDLPADTTGGRRLGYLAGIDDLADTARLDSGRWPAAPTGPGPVEAVLPTTTAALLGTTLGDQVVLGRSLEPTDPGDTAPVTVVVVGTVTPEPGRWTRDLLAGAGSTPALEYGVFQRIQLPAFGPFVVDPAALLGGSGGVERVSLLAQPVVTGASPAELAATRSRLAAAPAALKAALAGSDAAVRLDARLPGTLDAIGTQQAVTRSGVLVVAVVGLALAGTALGLAGRLVAGRRAAELALLTARGARRGQLVAQAAAESTLLALIAAAAAVPLSLLVFGALARLPLFADAGLSGRAGVTPALLAAVVAGALVLAAVLVAPSLRAPTAPGRRNSRGAVIRSGADVVLAALAVVGFLQLRTRPATSPGAVDPVLVAAPVLFLLAGAVLVLRVLPLLSRLAERSARRSRRLVLPLAAWEVARRPHATGAVFLLVLATAAATFGVAFTSTWRTSQTEQAAARIGTDLAVPAPAEALLGQGAEVAAATGGTVSPVAVQPVALGSAVRTDDGTATRLVAVDTRSAGGLLRGRPAEGTDWATLTADLAPTDPAGGLRLTGVPTVTLTGSGADGSLSARPTVLVADPLGSRVALTGDDVPLDGTTHPLALRDPAGDAPAAADLTVVGVYLDLALTDATGVDPADSRETAVQLTLQVGGATVDGPTEWSAGTTPDGAGAIEDADAAVGATTGGATLTARADVSLGGLVFGSARLVTTAATTPDVLPVLVSRDLADAAGSEPGDALSVTVGAVTLRAQVVGVVPYVPSLPDAPGVLADHEALARAMAGAGSAAPLTTGWWSGRVTDPAGAVEQLAAAGLPGAVTATGLADDLRDGPLRVGLLAAVGLLVVAAVALALTGTALHTAAALEARAVEVARLQGLGVPRRAVAGAQLLEHGAVTTLAVALGAAVGALAAELLAPLMTVSEAGAEPVPGPLPQWPWSTESLLVAGVLLGCLAVAVPVAASLGRRATAAHLRLDGGS